MNKIEKLNSSLTDGSMDVMMTYEDHHDVLHCNDDHIAEAVKNTSTADALASLITLAPQVMDETGRSIIESIRDAGYLDDYRRGDGTFCNQVARAIRENFYKDVWIQHVTEKHDRKRGCTTIIATAKLQIRDLIKLDEVALAGWTLQVTTELGDLIID